MCSKSSEDYEFQILIGNLGTRHGVAVGAVAAVSNPYR